MKYVLPIAMLAGVMGCRAQPTQKPDPTASPSASSSSNSSSPASEAPFAGATGSVIGTVRISGDAPPPLPGSEKIPVGKCFKAHERHKLLFRKAADGALADVLVGVTEYTGQLPVPTQPVRITMEDCSFSQRTVALMIGQSIELKNRGPSAGTPQLVGLPSPALMVAVPGGDPVTLTPHTPGKFRLVDRSNDFAFAEVYVLNYPTVAVSDEAGRFEVKGVPIGEVQVSAMLPLTELILEKRVTVSAGKPTEVNFDFVFKLEDWKSALLEEASAEERAAAAKPLAPPTPQAP